MSDDKNKEEQQGGSLTQGALMSSDKVRQGAEQIRERELAREMNGMIEEAQLQAREKEESRIAQVYGIAETDRYSIGNLMKAYAEQDRYNEYLVNGAVLTCDQATLEDFELPDGGRVILDMASAGNPEKRRKTVLTVEENPMSIYGQTYATVRDTVKGLNVMPFCCNCKQNIIKMEEMRKIKEDPECGKYGVCRHLMQLNEKWDNLPRETGYLKMVNQIPKPDTAGVEDMLDLTYEELLARGEQEGITMTSVLFCRHGGLIRPLTSGQGKVVTTVSDQYIDFLINYERGSGTEWQYAQDLGDGAITIAYGVVLKKGDNYPLTKEVYDQYMERRERGEPLTEQEAYELTVTYLQTYADAVFKKAEEEGWKLTQNRLDAIVDMCWNIGDDAKDFVTAGLLATGDLYNEEDCIKLRKEILETCATTINGKKQWLKNLVERRMDVILIALGGEKAYTRNYFESYFTEEYQNYFVENFGFEGYFDNYSEELSGDWNADAIQFLIDSGIEEKTVNQYPSQHIV